MKKLLFILLSCTLFGIAMSCSDDDEQPIVKFDSSLVTPVEDFTDPRDQKVYPCVRIGNQIWMTRNLCYQVPCNSFKGCFTWGEAHPDLDRIKVEPEVTPTDEQFITIVTEVANDPQHNGWSGAGGLFVQYIPMFITYYGMGQSDIIGMLKAGALGVNPEVEPLFAQTVERKVGDFKETEEERIKNTFEFQFEYGQQLFQETEEENDRYSEKYGMLYSYDAALVAVPEGWRLPSDEDWLKLEMTLGMNPAEAEQFDAWRGKGVATLMNENGESGLNLQRGGANVYVEFNEEKYLNKGENGYYWSSTKYQENDSTEIAVFRMSAFYSDKIWRGSSRISTGMRDVLYSVRCVKDVQ